MLEYTFREGSSADQLIAIHQHKADVAFLMAVADAPGAVSEHLWDERLYVAAPAAHPKAARDALTWADLRDEAFMVRAYDSGPIVYAWLAGKLDPGGYAPKIRQQRRCASCR
jgi:DNA-binding transcriptional LysR family regulator